MAAFLLAFPALFSIVNPIAGAFIFREATADRTHPERVLLARRVGVYSLLVMLVSLWAGSYLLSIFGISIAALRMAGGLVVGGYAWELMGLPARRESRKQDTYADMFMALVFLAWAPIPIAGSYYAPVGSMARQNFALLASVPQLLTAGLMVMAVYEEEKRRVERNMVALANLNLTTSSFVGSEIERTLSQALDRVLSVVQVPAGAILLRHSDARGPTAAVTSIPSVTATGR